MKLFFLIAVMVGSHQPLLAEENILPLLPVEPIEIPALPSLPSTIDLTQESEELWDKIRLGFAMPDISDELVLSHQQWYMAHPEYLRRMIERGRPYLHFIVSELERRNMPMELALLPMVESSFNPLAYSSAKAAGLWQFIPSTGRNFKLDQNWWQDERRDITASTEAALDYLQKIYEMHGDWHLALASYNWGEGAVGRAIAKNTAKGLPTDYSSLKMPGETRNYVPKLQALKNIFGNPALCKQLNLPSIPNRPFFRRITTPSSIDVKLAAQFAGMSLKDFLLLNPSHNRPLINDNSLLLPEDRVETFEENLNHHTAPLQTWEAYTLKPGEKLDSLATRYGLPLGELQRLNGINKRNKPTPGMTLLVPSKGNTNASEALQEWQSVAPKTGGDGDTGCKARKGKKGKKCVAPARNPRLKSGAKPTAKHAAKPAPKRKK